MYLPVLLLLQFPENHHHLWFFSFSAKAVTIKRVLGDIDEKKKKKIEAIGQSLVPGFPCNDLLH